MYEFKKLSEVDLLDTVPAGATILAEVDGVIRRVPSNGLGGAQSAVVEILPEQTVAFGDEGGMYISYFDWTFEEGETYTIVYDGVEYACVAADGMVGNTSLKDISAEDTGEPFAMANNITAAVMFAPTATESTIVEVYHGGTLLQRFTWWFDTGKFWATTSCGFVAELGQTYTIVWDGAEYQCELAAVPDEEGAYTLGNTYPLGVGDDTGEPFAMVARDFGTGLVVIETYSYDTAAHHTIRIYQGSGGVSWEDIQDKPFYDNGFRITATAEDVDLNTVAEFVTPDGEGINFAHVYDQTVTLEQLIGATMAVEHDGMVMDSVILTAENIQYADERALIISFPAPAGVAAVFFEAGTMSCNLDGVIYEVNVPKAGIYFGTEDGMTIFDELEEGMTLALSKEDIKQIEDKYIPDEIKLPTVTEADNGKVLMVVDGKWAVVDLPTT